MRNKTRLAVAIAAALGASFASTLVQAGTLANIDCTQETATTTLSGVASTTLKYLCDSTRYTNNSTETNAAYTTDSVSGIKRIAVPQGGSIYSTELFAGSSSKDSFILPNNATDYTGASTIQAGVVYTIKGSVDKSFDITFTLDSAKFGEKPYPTLVVANDAAATSGNVTLANGGTTAATGISTGTKLSSDKKSVTFTVDATTSPYLTDGAMFGLMYNLTGAGKLENQGEEIKMTAKLALAYPNSGTLVESTETVTVAKSAKATSVLIEPATTASEGKLKISVATNNTKFSGSGTGFKDATTGTIGFVTLKTAPGVRNQTGLQDWDIGNSQKAGIDTSVTPNVVYSTLQITNGQFAASKTGTAGKVYIDANGTSVVADTVDETTAIWNFTDASLKALTAAGSSDKKSPIYVQVSGTDQINSAGEQPPAATMTIQYQATKGKTVFDTVELRKIPLDGSRCTVYNVPPTSAKADILNLRITNPTNSSGTLTAYLYAGDDKAGGTLGDTIFENEDLLSKAAIVTKVLGKLSPWETIRLGSADIEKIATWEGRGVMIITSTLPKLEVYTLMRPTESTPGIPRPLSNVSVGAAGSACEY